MDETLVEGRRWEDEEVHLDCTGLTLRALRRLSEAIQSGEAKVASLLEGPDSHGHQVLQVQWYAAEEKRLD